MKRRQKTIEARAKLERTPSELRKNTNLTGDKQAKKDNLTVEELSINFNFDDLDLSFDAFEIDLDIDLCFDDFNFDFFQRTKSEQRETQRERKEDEARAKPEKNKIYPSRSQEEAVKNSLEAVRKRWVFGVFEVHKKGNEAREILNTSPL